MNSRPIIQIFSIGENNKLPSTVLTAMCDNGAEDIDTVFKWEYIDGYLVITTDKAVLKISESEKYKLCKSDTLISPDIVLICPNNLEEIELVIKTLKIPVNNKILYLIMTNNPELQDKYFDIKVVKIDSPANQSQYLADVLFKLYQSKQTEHHKKRVQPSPAIFHFARNCSLEPITATGATTPRKINRTICRGC